MKRPPRQKPGSFNLDHAMETVSKPAHGGNCDAWNRDVL
jgi:hypothetical protein